ncbi:MAG: metallophosphoesterase family protein [Lachnospiraceae bacterium]|nr:metallophosphoesterase family protein [Lachnospiraceae bacterium]
MERKLRFQEDGSFRILQLTDIHYTEDDERDHKTVALMRELIRREKPDFIITTGDTVYGEKNIEYLPLALAPLTESGIPWSFIFGNHDVEFAGNREELFAAVQKLPGCIAYHDPESKDGVGNHTIGIEDKEGRVRWLIFGIDSGDYNPLEQVGGYGFITPNQIHWYQEQIRRQEQAGEDFGVLAFQHMALPEYEELFRYEICYGTRREGFGCPRINTGFFAAMLQAGHSPSLFVGHDHVNDFYGKLYGVTLGYGRATGYGTYGAQDFARGGRVFVLNQENTSSYDTYVSLEGGIVVDDPWRYEPLERRAEG